MRPNTKIIIIKINIEKGSENYNSSNNHDFSEAELALS